VTEIRATACRSDPKARMAMAYRCAKQSLRAAVAYAAQSLKNEVVSDVKLTA
jgi:hypothetical protein